MNNLITLFGIPIRNIMMDESLDQIFQCLEQSGSKVVYFVNAHCVNISRTDRAYLQILQEADMVFADGVGMKIASQFLAEPLVDNVNGTDMYPLLCDRLQKTPCRVYLFGAAPGVVEKLKEKTLAKYPGMTIVGTRDGFFAEQDIPEIIQSIKSSNTDLLLVAMGVPLQEKWIAEYAKETGVKVAIGVGGLFNFYSDSIPRAPMWMRKTGLEWVHRLYKEPRRLWRRYLVGNLQFMWTVINKKMSPK